MKPLIDWVLIFVLFYIMAGIADRFLNNLRPARINGHGLDWELYLEEIGILYHYPENRGD